MKSGATPLGAHDTPHTAGADISTPIPLSASTLLDHVVFAAAADAGVGKISGRRGGVNAKRDDPAFSCNRGRLTNPHSSYIVRWCGDTAVADLARDCAQTVAYGSRATHGTNRAPPSSKWTNPGLAAAENHGADVDDLKNTIRAHQIEDRISTEEWFVVGDLPQE